MWSSLIGWIGWLGNPQDPPASTSQPPCPVIFMGSDDPKSDLHAYVANILPTELSCLSGYWPQILDPPALASWMWDSRFTFPCLTDPLFFCWVLLTCFWVFLAHFLALLLSHLVYFLHWNQWYRKGHRDLVPILGILRSCESEWLLEATPRMTYWLCRLPWLPPALPGFPSSKKSNMGLARWFSR